MPRESGGISETSREARIVDLRFEHLRETLGIGVASPRLSWKADSSAPGWRQTAFEIEVERGVGGERESTGKVESRESVLVAWPFSPLRSRERVEVRARLWGPDGRPTEWSGTASVEAGLLEPGDWKASFVGPDWEEDRDRPQPCAYLRREFAACVGLVKARLYATALGLYSAEINGRAVGDQIFCPGWTSYRRRLRYQTYDVTSLVREGPNALGAVLGEGWFRGRMGYNGGRRNIYGDRSAFLAQLELEYGDGSTQLVATDPAWRASRGPILSSEIYDGESYDARLEMPLWSSAGFDDSSWSGVSVVARDLATLVAPDGPPVRRVQSLAPVSISASPSGRTLVDFGQNLVGRLRIKVQGAPGRTIVMRHAEVLEGGELCTRPLRYAKAADSYTLKGGPAETWEPLFTFHGFRYAELEGWPGEIRDGDVEAVVCHSDLERTGWFECSDPLVDRLHENVVWSMRGNFLDIPTDCPQRDERLGWTGDIQIFAPTACFLYDTAGFLTSWLADLAVEQRADGAVPYFVPNINAGPIVPSGAWGDAAVIVPWVLYRRYGDAGILERQYASMRAWVDHVSSLAGESSIWEKGFQFGDWLDPAAPPERPGDSRTDPALVATAYLARSAELVGRAAGALGKASEAERYAALARAVREAFAAEYASPNGRVVSDTATAYSLVLEFGLLPQPDQRARAGERLSRIVREAGYRISTGFVGTPLVCDALCDSGDAESAFRLLARRGCPSWLYPVTMGATTCWERWDSMLPDGTVNPGDTTSFNHYALGAIGDWLHRRVGGLAPAEPGYRRIEIAPLVGGGLSRASARLETPYGRAECSWRIEDRRIGLEVIIPPNVDGRVILPRSSRAPFDVGPGKHSWSYEAEPERLRALTPDSSLSELFADPHAFARLVEIVPRLACLATITQISSSTTLAQQLDFLPDGEALKGELSGALARIIEESTHAIER